MKLAVISDIHGNYKAFEAFLEFARHLEPDGIVCLGDYVTDSPYPQRILGLLYQMMEKYPCYLVKGNREEYLIRNFHEPQGWKPSSSSGLLYYTAQHVTESDIAFFESLKICDTVNIKGYPTLTICHGAPDQSRGNFMQEPELKDKCMKALETEYLLGGHSHHQEADRRCGKWYVNPGSLGAAVDGVGRRAQFAVLHGTGQAWIPKLFSIPYDLDTFLRDYEESGLDRYGMVLGKAFRKTLLTGINYFFLAVDTAGKLFDKPLPEITEEEWRQVAGRLEL